MIVDKDDSKWKLLAPVLKISDSQRVKQVMARCGIIPVDKAGVYTRIVLVAMYFQVDISYVILELKTREELRRLAGVAEVPRDQGCLQVHRQVHSRGVHRHGLEGA